ncbi:reverse transcriptase zinc-binding domain-containing protein [Tanacetum coccineum]
MAVEVLRILDQSRMNIILEGPRSFFFVILVLNSDRLVTCPVFHVQLPFIVPWMILLIIVLVHIFFSASSTSTLILAKACGLSIPAVPLLFSATSPGLSCLDLCVPSYPLAFKIYDFLINLIPTMATLSNLDKRMEVTDKNLRRKEVFSSTACFKYRGFRNDEENGERKVPMESHFNHWVQIGVKMAWYKIVWFSRCTPKHSFILWLTILKRLSTQDKIIKWYPEKQVSRPLCEECPDSHEHLFFKCPYSMKIWNELKKKINVEEVNNDWENILNRVTDMACNNSMRSVLRRVVLAACVYYIWDERNKRLFGNQKRNHEALMQLIINNIRMKLVSLKVKNSI